MSTTTPEIPVELSVRTLAGAGVPELPADPETAGVLPAIEMAAHLEFTIDLELRVVAPAAGLLAQRLESRAGRYVGALRRIAHDEVDHAFAAGEMLRLFGPRAPSDCAALDDALESIGRHGLSPRGVLVVLFLVSESVVSTYLGGAANLPGDSASLRYLRDHARDEVGHGRFVRSLTAAMLGDPEVRTAAVGLGDPLRLAEALGGATRAYAGASLATLRAEGAVHRLPPDVWPPATTYAELLAGGLRPVLSGEALRTAFEIGLSGFPEEAPAYP